jgi:protein-L-isoaspartate(D-aspartate) O-methyltransferase
VNPAHDPQATRSAGKKRRGGALLALLLSAGGLLLLLAVFLLTTEIHLSPSDTAQVAQPVAAPDAGAAVADAPAGTLADAPPAASVPSLVSEPVTPAGTEASENQPRTSLDSIQLGTTSIQLSGPAPSVPFDVAARSDNPPFNNRDPFVDWIVNHTDQKANFVKERWDRAQIIQRLGNFTHERVREAFLRTPREYFSRDPRRAYENAVLPIGFGQTISGPHLVARMTDYLDPQPDQKVLEIGTGSGYQSALLSEISNHVFTIEIVEKLARQTDAIYKRLEPRYPEYKNIIRKVDDGYYGWEEYAPFDRIIVTCGIDHVPPALIKQLAPGGIMVIPIGPPSGQTILRIVKNVASDGTVSLEREDIYHGKHKQIFVPFTARGGGVHRADDQKD